MILTKELVEDLNIDDYTKIVALFKELNKLIKNNMSKSSEEYKAAKKALTELSNSISIFAQNASGGLIRKGDAKKALRQDESLEGNNKMILNEELFDEIDMSTLLDQGYRVDMSVYNDSPQEDALEGPQTEA